jgi:GT2 family glycosyltransferase
VSVVLINKDCGALVDVVFPTILRQTYSPLELVVVDNGSADDSLHRIRDVAPDTRILAMGDNTGFSHALNEGIRASRGDYILSLNFDVALEPEFVAALVDVLDTRPEIGWTAGAMRRLTADGTTDEIDCNGHYLLPSRYCYGFDPAHPDPASYDAPREVFGASACAALYRRTMLEALAVDGEIFDEDLFAYFEDVDLDWRAQRRGYACLFVPAARGAHMRGGSGLALRHDVAALLLANRFLVMLKNDDLRDVVRDAWPIAARTAVDGWIHIRRDPRALVLAAARVLRYAPRMLAKRRALKRTAGSGDSPVIRFRLRTPFLG